MCIDLKLWSSSGKMGNKYEVGYCDRIKENEVQGTYKYMYTYVCMHVLLRNQAGRKFVSKS